MGGLKRRGSRIMTAGNRMAGGWTGCRCHVGAGKGVFGAGVFVSWTVAWRAATATRFLALREEMEAEEEEAEEDTESGGEEGGPGPHYRLYFSFVFPLYFPLSFLWGVGGSTMTGSVGLGQGKLDIVKQPPPLPWPFRPHVVG